MLLILEAMREESKGQKWNFWVLKGPRDSRDTRQQGILMQHVLLEGFSGSWWSFRGRKGLCGVKKDCVVLVFSFNTFITYLDDWGSIRPFFLPFLPLASSHEHLNESSTNSNTFCIRMTFAHSLHMTLKVPKIGFQTLWTLSQCF